MYYFDEILGQKVLKSDFIEQAFFTLRTPAPSVWEKEIFPKIGTKRILTPTQTHSANVQIVGEENSYPETDGLITDETDSMIYLRFADCTPLVFYDPVKKVSAISHAGWRGTASKIGVKTIQKMIDYYGTKAKDVIVLVGPAISKCCYEVGDDVKEKLLSTVENKDNLFEGNFADLKKINEQQLREIGVENIDICPYCTYCNNDLFYSYRKENGTTNRHFAVLIS